MCRFTVTIILFFVTFISALPVRAENYEAVSSRTIGGWEYIIDNNGNTIVRATTNTNTNVPVTMNYVLAPGLSHDGTTVSVRFTYECPLVNSSKSYSVSDYRVSDCRVIFYKDGELPIIRSIPFNAELQSFKGQRYVPNSTGGGSYVDCYSFQFFVTATVVFPNWDDPDDPFGDDGGGGNDTDTDSEEDEECCPHHAAIQEALDDINGKLTVSDPGDLTLPSLSVPLQPAPVVSTPSLSLPEFGEVSEYPLNYFERNGFGELPNFRYDKLFDEFTEKFEDEFGIDLEW